MFQDAPPMTPSELRSQREYTRDSSLLSTLGDTTVPQLLANEIAWSMGSRPTIRHLRNVFFFAGYTTDWDGETRDNSLARRQLKHTVEPLCLRPLSAHKPVASPDGILAESMGIALNPVRGVSGYTHDATFQSCRKIRGRDAGREV